MKIIDDIKLWWTGATAFFTNAFDAVTFGISKVKQGVEWLATNKAALVTAVVGVCKLVYDFTVEQINTALESFQSLNFDHAVNGLDVGGFLAFGNCIFPISETFAISILLIEFWLACALIKLVLRFVPFI